MFKCFGKTFMIATLTLAGCSTVNKDMNTSENIPAASGKVTAKPTKDGNTRLQLSVKHMAPTQKVRQDATHYIAWVRPLEGTQAIPQNVGVLSIDENMEGKLITLTPLKTFNFFVTAEYSAQTATPSGEELMWTNFPSGTL